MSKLQPRFPTETNTSEQAKNQPGETSKPTQEMSAAELSQINGGEDQNAEIAKNVQVALQAMSDVQTTLRGMIMDRIRNL